MWEDLAALITGSRSFNTRTLEGEVAVNNTLLDAIAQHLGPAAYLTSDGAYTETPVHARLPDMVQELNASHNHLRAILAGLCEVLRDHHDAPLGMDSHAKVVAVTIGTLNSLRHRLQRAELHAARLNDVISRGKADNERMAREAFLQAQEMADLREKVATLSREDVGRDQILKDMVATQQETITRLEEQLRKNAEGFQQEDVDKSTRIKVLQVLQETSEGPSENPPSPA